MALPADGRVLDAKVASCVVLCALGISVELKAQAPQLPHDPALIEKLIEGDFAAIYRAGALSDASSPIANTEQYPMIRGRVVIPALSNESGPCGFKLSMMSSRHFC